MEWESDDHLYFTDKCRSCLKPLRKMYNLFEIFDQDLKLSDILKMTTFLEVKEDEGLSQYICEICMNIVVDFYNFINVYLENDKYVRSILEKRLAKNDSETGNEKEHKPVQELSRKGDIKLEFQESTEQYTCLPEEVCVLVVDDKNKDTVPGDHKDGLAKIKEEIIDNKSFRNQKKSSLRSFDRTRIEEYTILPEDECVVVVSGKRKNPEVVNDLTDEKFKDLQPAKYSCIPCNDFFLTKLSYIKHMSDKHQIKVSIKDYNSWKKLKMIPSITTPLLNVHDESICLTCKECEEEFTTLPELQEHLKTHVPYLCHVCGLSFRSKGSYKDHSSIHADIKLFLCSVCKKSFSRKSGLWKHQRLHTHPKQYVCEQCGKSFSENGSLTLHKKCVHVRARNFICEFCNLSFPLNSTLQKHIRRRHTVREKAFVCTVCNNTFREKASMLRHYKSKHSNLEKYTCYECKCRYGNKYSMIKHIKKHHYPKADLAHLSDYCEIKIHEGNLKIEDIMKNDDAHLLFEEENT